MRQILILPLLASLLCLSSCAPTSTLIVSLEAVIAAAEVALPILAATGVVPVALVGPIETALAGVSAATAETVTELQSTDTMQAKIGKITGYFAGTAVSVAGLPPEVAAILQAVNAAVQAFLADLQLSSTPAFRSAMTKTPDVVTLTRGDKESLEHIAARAKALHAKLEALHGTLK